jgi:hypothetical protein
VDLYIFGKKIFDHGFQVCGLSTGTFSKIEFFTYRIPAVGGIGLCRSAT